MYAYTYINQIKRINLYVFNYVLTANVFYMPSYMLKIDGVSWPADLLPSASSSVAAQLFFSCTL